MYIEQKKNRGSQLTTYGMEYLDCCLPNCTDSTKMLLFQSHLSAVLLLSYYEHFLLRKLSSPHKNSFPPRLQTVAYRTNLPIPTPNLLIRYLHPRNGYNAGYRMQGKLPVACPCVITPYQELHFLEVFCVKQLFLNT